MNPSRDLRRDQNLARGVTDKELNALQQKGQSLYREGKYLDALQYFNEVISKDSEPSITIFDHRAATYTKLGKLSSGLRDGRRIIEDEPKSCMGYLRAGQILQLLHKPQSALHIYQLGTRRACKNDSKFQLLQLQYDRLLQRCPPAKAVDPFQALPLELVLLVLRDFNFVERLKLLRVSKQWHKLLISVPGLWTELDFHLARKKPSFKSAQRYVNFAKGKCISLRLDHRDHNILSYVIERCKELRLIRLNDEFQPSFAKIVPCARALSVLILGRSCTVRIKEAITLIDECPNLEQIEFHAIAGLNFDNQPQWGLRRNVHTLVMRTGPRTPFSFPPLIDAFPNVQRLVLHNLVDFAPAQLDLSSLHKLEVVGLLGCRAFLPPKLPASIKEISMDGAGHFVDYPSEAQPELPCLKKLSMSEIIITSQNQLAWLTEPRICKLQQVNFHGTYTLPLLEKLAMNDFFSELRTLSLGRGPVNDDYVAIIAQKASRLEYLDLTSTHVTGVGVKAIVLALHGTLQYLNLSLCYGMSKDAVEWARTKVKTVPYSFPDESLRGRKVW